MIPKLIHNIWLDGSPPMSPLLEACTASQKQQHPSWQHKLWTDTNIMQHELFKDIQIKLHTFYHVVLDQQKLRRPVALYRADVLRLCILYVFGGLYLDSDLFVIKPFDDLLDTELLVGEIHRGGVVAEAVIGVPPQSQHIWNILTMFISKSITAKTITAALELYCRNEKLFVYPPEYFVPHSRHGAKQDLYRVTPNTHAIHCWFREKTYDISKLQALVHT